MKTTMIKVFVLVTFVVSLIAGPGMTSDLKAAAEEAAAAASGAGSAGAAGGTAAAASITTGTIAAGAAVAASIGLAVAASGGTTQAVPTPASQASTLENTNVAAATAAAQSMQKMDGQTTQQLSGALTTLPTAGDQGLALAAGTLSASEFSTMSSLAANANTGLNSQVAYPFGAANINAFMDSLGTKYGTGSNQYKGADQFFIALAGLSAANLDKVQLAFQNASATEITAIQTLLGGSVKLGAVDAATLNAIIGLVNSIGNAGTPQDIANAQAAALNTLLTAQHPGATVIVTTTHHGNNIWTTVAHVHK